MQTKLIQTKFIIGALLCALTLPAHATGMIAGATFPEQITQELTLVEQYATQAEQLQAQFQMVYNQARNLQTIPAQLWPNISSQLQTLVNLVGNAQGLSYGSQNTLAQVSAQYGSTSSIVPSYDTALQNWTSNLNNQIGNVLAQYGLQANDFQNTQSALQQIQNYSYDSSTDNGRMRIMQAGNQVSGLLVNQIQGLQSTIIAGSQAELNYMGNKANQAQQDRNNATNFIQGAKGNY